MTQSSLGGTEFPQQFILLSLSFIRSIFFYIFTSFSSKFRSYVYFLVFALYFFSAIIYFFSAIIYSFSAIISFLLSCSYHFERSFFFLPYNHISYIDIYFLTPLSIYVLISTFFLCISLSTFHFSLYLLLFSIPQILVKF